MVNIHENNFIRSSGKCKCKPKMKFHSNLSDYQKDSNKHKNTGNPCGLLLRMQTRTATMENIIGRFLKIKNRTTIFYINST